MAKRLSLPTLSNGTESRIARWASSPRLLEEDEAAAAVEVPDDCAFGEARGVGQGEPGASLPRPAAVYEQRSRLQARERGVGVRRDGTRGLSTLSPLKRTESRVLRSGQPFWNAEMSENSWRRFE